MRPSLSAGPRSVLRGRPLAFPNANAVASTEPRLRRPPPDT
eukprot:CAMPEP_0115630052 /NCGR_PEP_ID=MMETSP0272-20121206/30269_1 /TAXON_ID=71861 /ORGANISM="Scrippsiella trochoidea, Strain CCMP3099" /LENGTH=40 /DNA_ID= /DNA_START= /DNA_END= /DNA_ORIENTATION=